MVTVLNSIESVNFAYQLNGCIDSVILEITNIELPLGGMIEQVNWSLESSQENLTSNDSLPIFVLKSSQSVVLSLTLNQNSSCPITISKTIQINLLEDLALPKQLDICRGESIALNPAAAYPEYIYNWQPVADLENANAINPIIKPNQSTIYQLSYTDSTGLCRVNQAVAVKVRDTLPPILANFTVCIKSCVCL